MKLSLLSTLVLFAGVGFGALSRPLDGAPPFFLGILEDVRELEFAISRTEALRGTALIARDSYRKILARQRQLYVSRAIPQEEYEQSEFDYEDAEARARAYGSQRTFYEARLKQRLYQKEVVAKHVHYRLEDLYKLYAEQWKAECVASRDSVAAADIRVRLSRLAYERAQRLYGASAGSYYAVEARLRELALAEEDAASKRAIEKSCASGLPTLQELKDMQDPI